MPSTLAKGYRESTPRGQGIPASPLALDFYLNVQVCSIYVAKTKQSSSIDRESKGLEISCAKSEAVCSWLYGLYVEKIRHRATLCT